MAIEAETRRIIDQRLAEAGWSIEKKNVIEECSFATIRQLYVREVSSTYQTSPDFPSPSPVASPNPRKSVDYLLLGSDKRPLAIIEAKRDIRSPHETSSLYFPHKRR